jgi:hypothetical protein
MEEEFEQRESSDEAIANTCFEFDRRESWSLRFSRLRLRFFKELFFGIAGGELWVQQSSESESEGRRDKRGEGTWDGQHRCHKFFLC